ncbi:MAG: M28 family peptidase [candidate division WOR-3 bacterium]
MRKTIIVLSFCFTIALPLIAKETLFKVTTDQNTTVEQLVRLNLKVVAWFEQFCLVQADEDELIRLNRLGASFQKLDLPEGKELFYVWTAPGFDRQRLAQFGTPLTEDKNGVLLATTESNLLYLNRLPVQLRRISLAPAKPSLNLPIPPRVMVSESLLLELVSRVSADSVLASIQRLQDFYTRYSTTDSCRSAVNWMREKLIAYGCDSTALETFFPDYAPNCIGVKKGKVNPNQIYIICGHIDNTSDYAPERCPGSDDNASGTTAVLEAARVFQDIEFAYSVYFIGFSGEEQGLYGSEYYAQQAHLRGESIVAVLNFDMISYGRENRDSFNVIGRNISPDCAWLVDSFIANAQTYTTLKTRRRLVNPGQQENSDHASFWHEGYVAFCGIERDFTPMYHTIGDTIGPLYFRYCGTNNWFLATEAIKAAVVTVAKLAGASIQTGIAEKPGAISRLAVSPSVGKPPFHLVSPFSAEVEVFDALGKKVKSVNAACFWDGKDQKGAQVKPGVYLLRWKDAPSASATKLIITP